MSITKEIPEYTGTVPDRDSQTPSEFNDAADEYVDWYSDQPTNINEWAEQANSTASSVNSDKNDAESAKTDAESAKDTALASANFQGEWSSLSGSLSVPASVSHNDKYWMLLTDLADVTTSEPSDANSDWQQIYKTDLVNDTSPQLGGDLDGQGNAAYNVQAKKQAIGATSSNQTLDVSAYNYFTIEPTADISISFSNEPNGGLDVWYVELLGAGDHTITWDTGIVWDGGSAPTLASGTNKSIISFFSYDGGSIIYGSQIFYGG